MFSKQSSFERISAMQFLSFPEQKRYDVQSETKSRRRCRETCNGIFQRSYEVEMISLLTKRFRNPHFLKELHSGSRYNGLFENHGQADFDIRRESFLE